MSDQAARALAEALRLARAGYHLTPVTITRLPSGKKSARFHQGWRHESAWSNDPGQVRAWWVDHPDTSFALGGAANGLEGVDLDVHPDEGVDAVRWWSEQGLPLGALTQLTPSGGMHMVWRVRDDGRALPQEAGKTFGRGVDTRNRAGLFFAAGAYVLGEEGHYEVLGELPDLAQLARTPDEVLDLFALHAHVERAERPSDGRIVIHDRDWQSRQCARVLDEIRGHDRAGSGYRAKLQHAGLFLGRAVEQGYLDAAEAERLILEAHRSVWGSSVWPENVKDVRDALRDGPALERWREPAPLAPTMTAGLQRATSAAELQRGEVHASVTPPELRVAGQDDEQAAADAAEAYDRAEVEAILRRRRWNRLADEAERPPRPDIAALVVWDEDLESVPLPTMAVGELIPERGVGWLGGPSGTYKSFVGIQLARALAHGRPALEHGRFSVSRPRRVLYVAGEDSDGVAMRARAARVRLGVPGGRQFVMYPRPLDLTSQREVDDLAAFALAHGIEYVVVDTFRQSTLGVQENDNTEVGVVMGRLIALRDEHGIGSLLIDHTNKSAQGLADLGGAGAKRANADHVLMIDLPNGDRGADQQRTLRVAKLKNRPDGRTWPIRLETVPEVVDEEGVPTAVAIVGELARGAVGGIHGEHDYRDVVVPQAIREYAAEGKAGSSDLARVAQIAAHYGAGESGVSRAEVAAYFKADAAGITTEVARKRVVRAWDALLALGFLEGMGGGPTGRHQWVVPDAKKINKS